MSKHSDAEYNNLEKRFMKTYGQEHLCGNCIHTFDCPRMKIQGIKNLSKKRVLMQRLDFVKSFTIEPLERNLENINKMYFISVFVCERFKFDKGAN